MPGRVGPRVLGAAPAGMCFEARGQIVRDASVVRAVGAFQQVQNPLLCVLDRC